MKPKEEHCSLQDKDDNVQQEDRSHFRHEQESMGSGLREVAPCLEDHSSFEMD